MRNASPICKLCIANPIKNQHVQQTKPTKLVAFQYVWNADVIHLTGEGIEIGTVQ